MKLRPGHSKASRSSTCHADPLVIYLTSTWSGSNARTSETSQRSTALSAKSGCLSRPLWRKNLFIFLTLVSACCLHWRTGTRRTSTSTPLTARSTKTPHFPCAMMGPTVSLPSSSMARPHLKSCSHQAEQGPRDLVDLQSPSDPRVGNPEPRPDIGHSGWWNRHHHREFGHAHS